jgi:hypothetical protein
MRLEKIESHSVYSELNVRHMLGWECSTHWGDGKFKAQKLLVQLLMNARPPRTPFMNWKVRYHFHSSTQLNNIFSHMNSAHNVPPYSFVPFYYYHIIIASASVPGRLFSSCLPVEIFLYGVS